MSRWLLKAFVQGTISVLPQRTRWNRLLQKWVTKSLDPARSLDGKLAQIAHHVENASQVYPSGVDDLRVLELGTGSAPFIPIGLFLSGASAVHTFDSAALCTSDDVRGVLGSFLNLPKDNSLDQRLPFFKPERLDYLQQVLDAPRDYSARELLAKCNVVYMVKDARTTDLPDSGIDLFISNNVLEHIHRKDISEVFLELGRLAASGAVMSHFIDMSDHYAAFDKSIGVYNYLKYPSWRWWFVNNPLQYQNRLRMSDYRTLFSKSGWEIISEERDEDRVEELRSIRLAPEFTHYDEDDLLAYHAWVVCSRSG